MSDHVSPSFIRTRNSNTKNQSLDAYSKPVTSLMQDESCDDSKPVTFESTRVICNKNAQICCLLASMPSSCISSSALHSTNNRSIMDHPTSIGYQRSSLPWFGWTEKFLKALSPKHGVEFAISLHWPARCMIAWRSWSGSSGQKRTRRARNDWQDIYERCWRTCWPFSVDDEVKTDHSDLLRYPRHLIKTWSYHAFDQPKLTDERHPFQGQARFDIFNGTSHAYSPWKNFHSCELLCEFLLANHSGSLFADEVEVSDGITVLMSRSHSRQSNNVSAKQTSSYNMGCIR